MNLTLVISDNCKTCERAINTLKNIEFDYPNIKTSIIDKKNFYLKGIQITPALLINDELFSYGDIDKMALINFLT